MVNLMVSLTVPDGNASTLFLPCRFQHIKYENILRIRREHTL